MAKKQNVSENLSVSEILPEQQTDPADSSDAEPVSPSPRRFTVRGGGVHPELAQDHPGLFFGQDASIEVEEVSPGRWRLVPPEDVPQEAVPASSPSAPQDAPQATQEAVGSALVLE